MRIAVQASSSRYRLLLVAISSLLSGCAVLSSTWLASSGPLRRDVQPEHNGTRISQIRLIDVDAGVAQRMQESAKTTMFSQALKSGPEMLSTAHKIGPGDVLGITVWEAPPAALFSQAALSVPMASPGGTVTALAMNFPTQMVEADGSIKIPFAGAVAVAGKSPEEVDSEIERRLKRSANQPQVLVQIVNNNSSNVTVVGAVTQSLRMPLTPKGE